MTPPPPPPPRHTRTHTPVAGQATLFAKKFFRGRTKCIHSRRISAWSHGSLRGEGAPRGDTIAVYFNSQINTLTLPPVVHWVGMVPFRGPFCNTGIPLIQTPNCPLLCVSGRPIRDFIPIPPGTSQPHDTWKETLADREEALRSRHMRNAERWSERTKHLPPPPPSLSVGDFIRIQNQTGPHPNKWDKTGLLVEVRQCGQS